MNRYAFIDVSNTTGTTKGCLNFSVDWKKLYKLMTNDKWSCEDVLYYKGHKGEKERIQLENFEKIGYSVRTKLTYVHPDKHQKIDTECDNCGNKFIHPHLIRGHRKSNCDVELSVDATNLLKDGDEALIFSGDGDFAYLVEYLINKNIKVIIISSTKRDFNGNKRFSTRLSKILNREEKDQKRVKFIHINNWKNLISK